MKKWTNTEDNQAIYLLESGKTYFEISKVLGRTSKSVRLRMNRIGFYWKDYNKKEASFCLKCGTLLSQWQEKFCSHACSATYNNRKRKVIRSCDKCGKELNPRNKKTMFCSYACYRKDQSEKYISDWKAGKIKGWVGKRRSLSQTVRRYLLETRGTACSKCGWDEKHPIDGKSLTEINHIDGDAENCHERNLEIICPNCHTMTPNFRSRNKVSKIKR